MGTEKQPNALKVLACLERKNATNLPLEFRPNPKKKIWYHPEDNRSVSEIRALQFPEDLDCIVTTSPFVVQLFGLGQVYVLDVVGKVQPITIQTLGMPIDTILLKVFGIEDRPAHLPIIKILNKYLELVTIGQGNSVEALHLREKLDSWNSISPELVACDLLI